MKIRVVAVLCFVVLMGYCLSSAIAQVVEVVTVNEVRQIHFAERVVAIELVRALSLSVRQEREKCPIACSETGAMELAIGLIGVNRSDASADALINLLGLRLDGASSEELSCHILVRGDTLSRRLAELQVIQAVEHCQSVFVELRKRELANISDVTVEQACRSEAEIYSMRNELLKAIKSKVMCEL